MYPDFYQPASESEDLNMIKMQKIWGFLLNFLSHISIVMFDTEQVYLQLPISRSRKLQQALDPSPKKNRYFHGKILNSKP